MKHISLLRNLFLGGFFFSVLVLAAQAPLIVHNEELNSVKFIRLNEGSNIAEAYGLNWLKSEVLKADEDYSFRLIRTVSDELGFKHLKYQQYYKNIKVEHGVYILHVRNGWVESANGEFYADLSTRLGNANAMISASQAYTTVKALFQTEEITNHLENQNAPLIYYTGGAYHLCYKFELSSFSPLKHSEFYVDAKTGRILQEINKIHTVDVPGSATTQFSGTKTITCNNTSGSNHNLTTSGRNLYTRNANNGTNMTTATEFTNSSATWTATSIYDKSVFDLHFGLEKSYDYFQSKFSRNSFDNLGGQIRGIAHYGSNYVNAFWSSPYMVFGDGNGTQYLPFTPTDIVGHEFTHAVTQYEANLVYMNQSGALNESFSDIFGVCVDFYANPLTANFLEGEQCSVMGVPFRNMTNPNATSQPDTYNGTFWVPANGPDNGGVHTNSQVQNFWFYLLCQGGSGINDISQNYSVSGIGITFAERIAYRNLSVYLTANSTFADARMYSIQSAIDLYGNCSNQVIQTTNAWHAVGVGNAFSNAITAQFAANPSFSCSVPAAFSFTNQSVNGLNYQWFFGDGATSTATNPVHTYTAVGSYTVKLKAFGSMLCNTVDSIIKNAYINISNTGSPTLMCQPLQGSSLASYGISNVSFSSISNLSGGANEGYQNLTCSHQTTLTAGSPYLLSVTKVYGLGRLAVWIDYNNDGVMNQSNELIYAVSPSVSINTHTAVINTPTSAVLGVPLRMRVYDDVNQISSYCQTHTQGQTEDYAVRFYATTVKPQANFFTTTRTLNTNSNCFFQDSSLYAPTSWNWTFQGASVASSTLQNPTVFYTSPGTYSVKLVATNGFGSDSITKLSYITVINNFNLCSITSTTSAGSGVLYDTGGPTGNYQNYEYCTFLINPGCTGTISLNFSSFSTESCCDYLSVYNGSTTGAPLLGSYSGYSLPPTLNANSGKMLIVWSTDGSVVSSGFAATWTSTLAGTTPPVANFSVSNNNPPINTPVQFTDLTSNTPNVWLWQFGDGTFSNLQHPVKTYSTSGVRTVTLTASNCSTAHTIVQSVTVQSIPSISISPLPLTGTVNCGDSLVIPFNLQNTGLGQLSYTGSIKSSFDSVRVLICTYGVDMSAFGDYQKTLNAISSYFTLYSVSNYTGNTAAGLQSAIAGKDVVLFPRQSSLTDSHYTTYSTALNNFANAGGTVIFCGTSGALASGRPINTGLFTGLVWSWGSNFNVNIVLPNDSLVYGLGSSTILAPNLTTYYNISNTNKVTVASYLGYDVITYRNIGAGRAIIIGADYFTSSLQFNYILSRAVRKSRTKTSGYLIPASGLVNASSTQSTQVVIKTTGMPSGVYTATMVLNGNQVPNPMNVPITYTVQGTVSAALSASCINFGSIMQNTSKLDSVTITNSGCSALQVSALNNSLAVFSYSPGAAFSVPAWSSTKLYVSYNPTLTGASSDTLRLTSNLGEIKICLQGNSTIAPSMSVTPSSFTVVSPNCNATQTISLNIANTGGSNLNYTVSSSIPSVQVLAITNYVDMLQEFPNTISSLNTFYSSYSLTTHSLTSIAAFQAALVGKHVLLIPEQELYVFGFMQSYSTTINNFVSAGGTAILCGSPSLAQINDVGLFPCSAVYMNPGTVNVVDTNDAIMTTIPMGAFTAPSVTYYNIFTGSGNTDYMKAGIYSVVTKRNIGLGRAIYLGFDYTTFNTNSSKVLANSVKSAVNLPSWLSVPLSSGVVSPSLSTNLTFTLNSANLVPGTYTSAIVILSNDPLAGTFTVPVTYSVSGAPSASISANCIGFGNVMQYTNKTDSVILYNTGCVTMSVSALTATQSVFSYTPSTSFTIAPWSSRKIYVRFSPSLTGVYSDTLKLYSNGGNVHVCLSGTAFAAPSISVNPASLSAFAPQCNTTQTVNLQVINTGGSNLSYSISGAGTTSTVQVLALTNGVDMGQEYVIMLQALNSQFTGYSITQHFLTNVSSLQAALVGKQVLLIPEMESYTTGLLQTYSTAIAAYVNAGGRVVLCGSGYVNQVNDLGLFTSSYSTWLTSNMSVVDTNDYIMRGLPMGSIPFANATYYHTFTNSGNTDYVKFGTYSIVSKRNIGLGQAIYLGFDYFAYTVNTAKMLANCIKGSGTMPGWLSAPTGTAVLSPSNTANVTFTFSSAGLSPGTYTYNLLLVSNSPLVPTLTVPVTYTVSGTAAASLSPNCISFGNVIQHTTKRDSVTLFNTGCATMTVSSITATNSVFSHTPSTTFTLGVGASRKIYVSFSSSVVGVYSDTLRMVYNGGIAKVCLSGTILSAPAISITPVPLLVNSIGCNATQTVAVTIQNTGGSSLSVGITGGNSSSPIQVLAITNYVDMFGEYPIMIGAINSFFTNYTITQHFLTNVPNFQTALNGKNVLLIPEQETYVIGFMQTYSAAIAAFVSAGGSAIICGTGGTNQINDIGLFNATYANASPSFITVVDTNDAIMRSLPMGNIVAPNATFYNTFTNPGITDFVKTGIYSVVSKRNIGLGRAVYIGFDYFQTTPQVSRIISNAVKSAFSLPSWLSIPNASTVISPSLSTSVIFTLNSSGLTGGTYTYNLIVNSNDPLTPSYTVPVSFSVNTAGTSSLSSNCLNFGSILQGTSKVDSISINNIGCSTMTVTALTVTNSVFTYSPAPSFTVGAGTSKKIYVTFNPLLTGSYSDTLRIFNTGGNKKVCLNGSAYGNPVLSMSPPILSTTLAACGSSQTLALVISNTGGSTLSYTAPSVSSATWINTGSGGTFSLAAGSSHTLIYTVNSGSLTSGTHTGGLVFISNAPGSFTYTQTVSVMVGNNPCTDFAFNNPNDCSGAVTFTQQVINTVTSYSWNFGDGTGSNLPNPSHTYSNSGVYTVTLTACNGTLCSSMTKTLSISSTGGPLTSLCNAPTTSLSANYGILNVKLNTLNHTSGTSLADGGYQDFSCYYQTTLVAGSSYSINVSTAPFNNENVKVWIDYDNSASFSPSELVFSSSNVLMSHTGTIVPPLTSVLNTPLRMRVEDDNISSSIPGACSPLLNGQAEDYAVIILPGNLPPVVNFSANVNACTGTVTFTDQSTYSPNIWLWNFGDGGASNQQHPTYTYTASGTYSVTLMAGNSFGNGFSTQTLNVSFPAFSLGYTGVAQVSTSINFTTSYSGANLYTWNFGDGNLSGLQNATHTYSVPGTYTVSLTIVTGSCINTSSLVINVGDFVGINSQSLNQAYSLQVYPNPFSEYTQLFLNMNQNVKLKLELVNSLGQIVREVDERELSKGEYVYDLRHLSAGIYYLKISQENSTYLYKLISTY